MTQRTRSLILVVASALVVVGCGSGSDSDDGVADLSATKLLATAKKQLKQEEFVTIKGQGSDKDAGEIKVDLAFAGETADGTVDVSGMTLEVLKASGKSYFKADEKFFESTGAPAEALDAIRGKWVLIDPNNPSFGEIGNFVSKDKFVGELLDPDSKVSKGKEKKVNGVDCVALKDKSGILYLDKKDGRPVSVVTTDDGEGTLNFSYDEVDEAEAPASDEIVDLAKLGA